MQSVLVKDLAVHLGVDRSGMLRLVKRLGIIPHRQRSIDTRYQAAAAITQQEADRVIQYRISNGFTGEPFGLAQGRTEGAISYDEAVESYLSTEDAQQPSESASEVIGGVWHLRNGYGLLGHICAKTGCPVVNAKGVS